MIKVQPTDKLVFDLEMLQIDFSEQKRNLLKKEISEKYGVPLKNITVNFIPVTVTEDGERMSLTSDIITNIQDPKFQQKLFSEYIKLKDMEDVDLDGIIDIDNKINAFVDFDSYSKFKQYKIKYVKWDNYLSYGKGNYFDFTKLKGLILLNGYPENQSGKTTFATDLLRFALFGRAEKSPTLDSVFNRFLPEETEVMVEAGLEIEGSDYVIRRTVTRPTLAKRTKKSKPKQKIEYFKVVGNDYELIENCEGENASETNNIIRESVGNVEDFNLVISANAYNLGELLKMGQADKSRLFSKWLGLLTIEEKERIAKETYKTKISPNLYSNKYDKATLLEEVNDMMTVIKADGEEIESMKEKLAKANENIISYNNEKVEVLSKRKEIKEGLSEVDITSIENKIGIQTSELETKRGQMTSMRAEYDNLKDSTFDGDVYKVKQKELLSIESKKSELRTNIAHIKEENTRIARLIEQKICPTCGQNINAAEKADDIEKNNKKVSDFVQNGIALKTQGENIQSEITEMEVQRSNVEKLNNLKLRMTAVKAQIDNIKLQIENLKRQKEEIETNKENIRYNNEIDNKIRVIDESLRVETSIKESNIRSIQQNETAIANYQKQIENRNVIIAKLNDEEKVIRNWSIYQELVGKNGIIKIALRRVLPVINNEIARILNGLCDFVVDISISDDNKVCLDFLRDGEKFDLAYASSGFEGTMASLAIRMALSLIGNMPKPNMLILDEIVGPIAGSNFDNMRELFERILDSYDFILHICHEGMAEDWHNNVITVTKENNISRIELK